MEEFWGYSIPAFFIAIGFWFGLAAVMTGIDRIKERRSRYIWVAFPVLWLFFTLVGVILELNATTLAGLWFKSNMAMMLGLLFWATSFVIRRKSKRD